MATPSHFVPGTLGPISDGCYLQASPGWQPWNISSMWQVTSWDTETIPSAGYTNPPPSNTSVLAASVNMGAYTLKVWLPTSAVQPLG
jgi:hypothetical protein